MQPYMPALQPLTQTQHAPQRSPHSLDNFTFDFRRYYRRADGKPFHMDWYINQSPPAIPTQRNTLGPPSTKQSPPQTNHSGPETMHNPAVPSNLRHVQISSPTAGSRGRDASMFVQACRKGFKTPNLKRSRRAKAASKWRRPGPKSDDVSTDDATPENEGMGEVRRGPPRRARPTKSLEVKIEYDDEEGV